MSVRGAISISYDSKNGSFSISSGHGNPEINEDEKALFENVQEILKDHPGLSKSKLEKRSSNYTSIVCGSEGWSDFMRFKFSPRAKWISIRIANEDVDAYRENPLFDAQKNKNQAHWKAAISSVNDVFKFSDLIKNACSAVLRS